ncbi:MAG: PepSY domain-containing protein [Caulobacteraceae bacterium]
MKLVGIASWVHKWLALFVGVQVLLWIISGAFFAVYPIERVRSEHRIAVQEHPALNNAMLRSTAELIALLDRPPAKLSYERDAMGRAVAIAEFAEGRPVLMDAESAQVLSPLNAEAASGIARAAIAEAPAVREAILVSAETPEYRGALPAWRVAFEDEEGLAVYVAADTGRVTARRSDLWRVYDALWALHIMDWRDHENFNTGLLIAASIAALVMVIFGVVLIPYRFGWVRRRAS